LPLAYMAGLFVMSSVPGDDPNVAGGAIIEWLTPQLQNLLHIPLYAGLAGCWLWALSGSAHHTRLTLAFALTLAWAVFDEWYQTTVPGRYGSVTDLALNVIGASLAIGLAGFSVLVGGRSAGD
jgi:VanZ family protein